MTLSVKTIYFVMKAAPIVASKFSLNSFVTYRYKILLFPTPYYFFFFWKIIESLKKKI